MIKSIIGFLYSAIAVRQYLIFSLTFFLMIVFVLKIMQNQILEPNCPGMLHFQFLFSKNALLDAIKECGANGVKSHTTLIWIDFIFIFAYSGLLSNYLGYSAKRFESNYPLLIFSLPIWGGLFDVAENIFQLIVLSNPLGASLLLLYLIGITAAFKFLLILISILIGIYYSVIFLKEFITKYIVK